MSRANQYLAETQYKIEFEQKILSSQKPEESKNPKKPKSDSLNSTNEIQTKSADPSMNFKVRGVDTKPKMQGVMVEKLQEFRKMNETKVVPSSKGPALKTKTPKADSKQPKASKVKQNETPVIKDFGSSFTDEVKKTPEEVKQRKYDADLSSSVSEDSEFERDVNKLSFILSETAKLNKEKEEIENKEMNTMIDMMKNTFLNSPDFAYMDEASKISSSTLSVDSDDLVSSIEISTMKESMYKDSSSEYLNVYVILNIIIGSGKLFARKIWVG